MKPSIFRLLPALFVLSVPALAKDIFVSTSGVNTNPGTLESPLRNIQNAVNIAVPGDTIQVRALNAAGTQAVYAERVTFNARSGTAGNPITLRNYAGDLATDGTQAYPALDLTGVAPAAGLTAILTIVNANYVTVSGLELRNYSTSSDTRLPAGIYIAGKGTGVRLERNKVHHIMQNNAVRFNDQANGFGIAVYGSNAAASIDQLVLDGNEVYSLRTGQSESVVLNGNVTNFQVINNSVHDCNNIGIDCIGFEQSLPATVNYARNGVVRGNHVYNIDSQYNPGYGGNFAGSFASKAARNDTRGAPGIYVDGGAGIVVEGNNIHHCNFGLSFGSEHAGRVTANCVARNNLIRYNHVGGVFMGGADTTNGGASGCSIINNTFFKNDTENYGGGSVAVQNRVTSSSIRQNVFVCDPVNRQFILNTGAGVSFGGNTIDYNVYSGCASTALEFIWRGTGLGSFTGWKAGSGQDAHSLFVTASTALFVAAAPVNVSDFSLGKTSSALNTGDPGFAPAAGELDYFGNPRVGGTHVDVGMSEGVAPSALLVLEHPTGTALTAGTAVVDFGPMAFPGTDTETFDIKNTGEIALTGLKITVDGTNAADFTASAVSPAAPIAPGASTGFSVTFNPSVIGARTAKLHIASNSAQAANFTITLRGNSAVRPALTKQPLSKTVNPGAAVSFSVAATSAIPLKYQWRKDATAIPGATAATYTIAKATEANQGTYDVEVTNGVASVTSDPAQLTVNDAVAFDVPLEGKAVPIGGEAIFSVAPQGTPPFTYQWRRNGVNIAGATSNTLKVSGATFANSGLYSVAVKNMLGTVVSASAPLNVGDPAMKVYKLPAGGKVVMTGDFAGTFYGYAWSKEENELPFDSRLSGAITPHLTITNLHTASPNDAGIYHCTAYSDGGNLVSTARLIVYGHAPLITVKTVSLPAAIVGGAYFAPGVSVDPSLDRIPTSFTATGLPEGLTMNRDNGSISGVPTVALAADHVYPVKLIVSNAKGSAILNTTLMVKIIPTGSVGTFTGPVTGDAALNNNLGGRMDVTVAARGSYTGKLTVGSASYSFTGALVNDVNGVAKPHGNSIVKRPAPLSSLNVSFDVDYTNQVLANGVVADSGHQVAFSAWRNKWVAPGAAADVKSIRALAGYYTIGWKLAEGAGLESVPQGMGFGSFTVGTTGALTVTGRLADGAAYSYSTFVGPHGEMLAYLAPYGLQGSVYGTLQLTVGTAVDHSDNVISGAARWLRLPTATGQNYKAGFGPVALTAFGGRYMAPVPPAIVLGLRDTDTVANAQIQFTQGGIADTHLNPGIDVRIQSNGNVILQPVDPCYTTLSINSTTGVISGGFQLTDANPAIAGARVTRNSTYYGIIVKDTDGWKGRGFFLLAKRPHLRSETVATTPLLSGMAVLSGK